MARGAGALGAAVQGQWQLRCGASALKGGVRGRAHNSHTLAHPPRAPTGRTLEERKAAGGGGGGGLGHQQWPDTVFPLAHFVFPRDGHFGLEYKQPKRPMVLRE